MIDYDKPVRVFKNPTRGCYSIMQNGTVKASAKQIRLQDVEFRVRESGRQRMLRIERKTLHAFVVGRLVEYIHPDTEASMARLEGRGATYNPFRYCSFVDCETETPLRSAQLAQLDENGLTYS